MNFNFDPLVYINSISESLIGQIHLAGFTDMGTYLFDTHSKPVSPRVWEIYSEVISRAPEVPVMVEWDDEIPEFPVLENEVHRAKEIWEHHHGLRAPPSSSESIYELHS